MQTQLFLIIIKGDVFCHLYQSEVINLQQNYTVCIYTVMIYKH